ncbi:unnamed protein product [Paramecium pentaurelia]|uniref:Uncharacterized protein n=1 Tax=Paramecium pentaurelia TaxID=43138 RepID=A0A8S1XC87_9CILI|nr:unnamed protein product [Paramecium pentaurelia]
MQLDSKTVAIVTGGASGLGLATVELLIQKQCKVVAADFNEEKGEELIKRFENCNLRYFKCDVQNEEEIRKLIEFTITEFGQINLVVNSAGIPSAQMTATRSSVASTSEMNILMQINVIGTFNVCKYAAQHMIKSQVKGVIVNVASLAGIEGQRGQVIYSASKGAVIAMTLPMARDLGKHGIRVVTIAPGIIYTPMFEMIQPKIKEQLESQVALGRLGAAKEFAQLVEMIYQSEYLTGCVLRLDGGLRVPHL